MQSGPAAMRLTIGMAMALSTPAMPAFAQGGADFYKGKSVTMIVATAPGGGYDLFGRLVSEFMERRLGSTFVVRNMPGAGHLVGGSYIYASKPDGLTIGTFSLALIYYQLTQTQGARYDLAKMSWIGKASSDKRVVLLTTKHAGKSFDDIKNLPVPLKMAASGAGSANYTDMAVVAKVAGLPVQIITGYNGNAAELAMRRGEVDGGVASFGSAKPFVDAGHARFFLTVSNKPSEIPRLIDVVKTNLAERMTALIGSMNEMIRVYAGPPGIPADRLEALRAAYKSAVEDPAYIEKLKQAQQPHDPAFGDEVAKLITDALNQPPEAIALLKEIANEARNIKTPVFKGEISKLENDARTVSMKLSDGKDFVAKVSGSRTAIKVGGSNAKRDTLKIGMKCSITAPASNAEAELIDCQ